KFLISPFARMPLLMKLAFIGLGAMGFPMARHLSKQHELIVWNRTREKAERHSREYGGRLAGDLADTAQAEVIITMLPTSREVDEIVGRLLPSVRRGTLWIDATSGDPNVSRETAKRLAEKSVEAADAPRRREMAADFQARAPRQGHPHRRLDRPPTARLDADAGTDTELVYRSATSTRRSS